MRELLDRAVTWANTRLGYKPEPPGLDCRCARETVIVIGCLRCDYATCEQHRSDPHDCAKETADAQ